MTTTTDRIAHLIAEIEKEYETNKQRRTGMRFEATFLVDTGVSFDEAKFRVYSYEPFQKGLKAYAFVCKDFQHTPASMAASMTEYPTAMAAYETFVKSVGNGKVLLETLEVACGDETISADDEWHQAVSAAFSQSFNCVPAQTFEEKDPRRLRRILVKERLEPVLRSGTNAWNQRPELERALFDWRDTDLSGCKLDGFQLTALDLAGSSFERATMKKAQMNRATLANANFSGADLTEASLDSVEAASANFAGANLKGATLEKADLKNCSFEKADLTKAKLNHADLTGADLSTATVSKDSKFKKAVYDERTKLPSTVDIRETMVWKGVGPDPLKLATKNAVLVNTQVFDIGEFIQRLNREFDPERVKKSLSMLKKETFQLFCEVDDRMLIGVVKSQTDADLVYACQLRADGVFCCCTQNLNACGGLRGAMCKHLLVLSIGLVQAKEIDASECLNWILASRMEKKPQLDRDRMAEVFLKYKGAESGEIDWRPTETIPEDYYAF